MVLIACSWSSVLDDDLDFDLGDEINAVLGAAIDLAMAALATKAPHFGYGHAGDAPFAQGFLHVLKGRWPEVCFNLIHCWFPLA